MATHEAHQQIHLCPKGKPLTRLPAGQRLAAMYGPLSFLLPALSGHVPTLGRVKGAEGIAKRHDIWGRGPRCRALEAADWGHNHRAPGAGRGSRVGAPGSTCLQRGSARLHQRVGYERKAQALRTGKGPERQLRAFEHPFRLHLLQRQGGRRLLAPTVQHPRVSAVAAARAQFLTHFARPPRTRAGDAARRRLARRLFAFALAAGPAVGLVIWAKTRRVPASPAMAGVVAHG